MGLSLYNSPEHTLKQRANFVAHQYGQTVLARWGRIFPAFSIGGVLNKTLRRTLHSTFSSGKW
jgi:hypothetical protein